jgi:S-methylmethionine-dependent homocysteine/selenocysteine methylase
MRSTRSDIKEAARLGAAHDILGRLADGDVVVIDGGTGTQLQAEGAPMDDETWSARASLEHPGLVQSVHEAYIRAGADVIIANTFATNRAALEPAGLGARVAEANHSAVRAALRAREAAGRPVTVAGSMSSFCAIAMHGRGPAAGEPDAAAEDPRFPSLANFREQAALLADAGVDLIALELMEAPGYGRAAIQAATETGLPVWLGVAPVRLDDGSLGTDPELGSGLSFTELVRQLATPDLAAVTVMHAKPDAATEALGVIREYFDGPVGVYAESGDWAAPNWVFNGLTPDEYLLEADSWVSRGAQIIGGCCGVGPEHIRVLADRLTRPAAGGSSPAPV